MLHYTYLSVRSVSSCTDYFICSLFVLSSPSRSRIFDKQEARENVILSCLTWNRWSPSLLTHSVSKSISSCYRGNSSVHYRPHYKYSQCQSSLRAGSLVRVRGTLLAAEPPTRKRSVKEYCDSFLSLSNLPCVSNLLVLLLLQFTTFAWLEN